MRIDRIENKARIKPSRRRPERSSSSSPASARRRAPAHAATASVDARARALALLANGGMGRLRRVARLLADADRVLVAEPRRGARSPLRLRGVAVGLADSVR